ncbi:hypothetical protein Gohar_015307 [Gossypium harknessii]|uniref:Uncharacterized protein n=1 Tax=Gossypium harknessii TaxID=34285 RepID=A0A7J9FZA7_9ROSI|nr:hypothetical protein [Gossypium harknessii]
MKNSSGQHVTEVGHPSIGNWCHLHTDGVVKPGAGFASAGRVVRDHNGRWILEYNHYLGECSVFDAELNKWNWELIFPSLNINVGSRSALFSATDPQVPEYCELLKADEWPVCAFISQDCRPTNPSEEAHSVETSFEVWEKTLEMIGLPSDAVERLIEGKEVKCRYGTQND